MGFKNCCLGLMLALSSLLMIKDVSAQEITAIDFNGDLLGKVIPDGKVVSFENELIGNITADSLIANTAGDLIGGVVPQGIAIGNDNKLLGKVNADGSVRLSSGKIIGKVLPSGLVVDDFFNIIGSVLFPGLIYGDDGAAIGRLTGDGFYTNLQGNQIGFISADGYAYRKAGDDNILEGKLISSKMVVSNSGDFIGSINPGGKITNFDSTEVGAIKANGFAYDANDKIIGRIVKSGYAFDNAGKYIGFVTYNGEVTDKDQLIGHLTSLGNIIDASGATIGFAVDISATATDFGGKYLGRIMPKGEIAKGKDIIGRMGSKGLVFNPDGVVIGRLIATGPVFDYQSSLRAHALKNGGVVNLAGSPLGNMRGHIAYDNQGHILGAALSEKLFALGASGELLGVPGINATIKSGEEITHVSPFGYVFSNTGNLIGSALSTGPVYSLAGAVISELSSNGELLNRGTISLGKITESGLNLDERNLILGKTLRPKSAVSQEGAAIGFLSTENLVFDANGKVVAKILPDASVISDDANTSAKVSPKIGEAFESALAFGINGELLGTIDFDGSVRDAKANIAGKLTSGNQVIDPEGEYIGTTLPYGAVVDDKCQLLGVISSRGNVRNFREVNQGKILVNGQLINEVEKVIGHLVEKAGVIDLNGNILGTSTSTGNVLNYKGESLGCLNKRGLLQDSKGAAIAALSSIYPVMDFNGNLIGRSTIDGTVVNDGSQIFGYVQPTGNINSKTGIPLGNLFKYKVAFDNNNQFMGRVLEDGRVVDKNNQEQGRVDFIGYVVKGEEKIGYALYDMYVYDKDFNVFGYIAKDGNVLSFSNAGLGRIDRGFLLDKNQNVIGRGNRDFYIRDASYLILGELGLDGRVTDLSQALIGTLEKDGGIINASGIGIANAKPLQYYDSVADRPKVYNEEGRLIGFVGGNDIVVNEEGSTIGILKSDGTVVDGNGNVIGGLGIDWYEKVEQVVTRRPDGALPEVGVQNLTDKAKKSFNIALTPDGEYLGEILDDGRVVDQGGKLIGRKMPDGLIIDDDGALIGIEETKKPDADGMFVPAGTFGKGGAYGTGAGAGGNLGPGGGYGPGERYDPQRAAALAAAQQQRRQNIDVGRISTNANKEAFDGLQKDWKAEGVEKSISSWRVDMSQMILADKPIPAVIARSIDSNNPTPVTAFVERNVYAEEGRNVLIPAGSRLIGNLGSVSSSTDEATASSAKIEIVWDRLIRPDGSMFRFQGKTGDAQGRGGALGYLDQQLFKRYTLPIMTTAITSYTSYLMADDKDSETATETSRQQAASDARQNFLNDMNRIFEQILADKTSIRPLTYVPAGTRIIVYPNVDLWLRTEENADEKGDISGTTDILIDDKKMENIREAEARGKVSGSRSSGTSGSGSVVYEAEGSNAQAQTGTNSLINDAEMERVRVGSTPPPPPPSYAAAPSSPTRPAATQNTNTAKSPSGSSSSSTTSSSSVPQLF